MTRKERLVPNGVPRWVRCYDKDNFAERYTVVYTGRYKGRNGCDYVGMSPNPYHPQGIGQHGWSETIIDKPQYSHLGKKIKFEDLPEDCKKVVLEDYYAIWNIKE